MPLSCGHDKLKPVEWTESWVSNVHCGRRWRFQRFVPPSLMSALISRFYGMGKRGSAILSRRSIYIKIPICGGSSGNGTGRWVGQRGEVIKNAGSLLCILLFPLPNVLKENTKEITGGTPSRLRRESVEL